MLDYFHNVIAWSMVDQCSDRSLVFHGALHALLERCDFGKQRNFWHFYDAATGYSLNFGQSILVAPLTALTVPLLTAPTVNLPVVDGQHLYYATHEWQRDLSSRQIRSIVDYLLESLGRELLQQGSVEGLLRHLGETLREQVSRYVRWIFRPRKFASKIQAPRTRELVLAFIIHTGSSPPTAAPACPAAGRALVSINKSQVNNETIRRRHFTRGLRDSLLCARAQSSRRQSARPNACARRSAEPAGHWRARKYSSMGKLSGTTRIGNRW